MQSFSNMDVGIKSDNGINVMHGPLSKNDAIKNVYLKNVTEQAQHIKIKRKHRRGKPKSKYVNKPYKNANWQFQAPSHIYHKSENSSATTGGRNSNLKNVFRSGERAKLLRSNSFVPYNTNRFLMDEHLAEVPNALLTPSSRTRDSSFSVDSEDNYIFSLPEDEEEFLTKEFANVYEKARIERLENLTKEQLIEECLQIEDRYSTDQGVQRQHEIDIQNISSEYLSKIRLLEEKVVEITRENYNLRTQLMRSAAAAAAAASPPSAAVPTGAACQRSPMESASEDSETDSSVSGSSSSSDSSDTSIDEAEHDKSVHPDALCINQGGNGAFGVDAGLNTGALRTELFEIQSINSNKNNSSVQRNTDEDGIPYYIGDFDFKWKLVN